MKQEQKIKQEDSIHPSLKEFELVDLYYVFKNNSTLHQYLKHKINNLKEFNTLREILTFLKHIIKNEKMFDDTNPAIILCSKDLETALNMKALHVTEIRDVVVCHLYALPYRLQRLLGVVKKPFREPFQNCEIKNKPTIYQNENNRFTLTPDFYKVFEPVVDKKIFSYSEITKMLSDYILSNKEKFFDPRNIKVALVENDPLGIAFQVKSFHRCQVTSLLRKQILLCI